MKLNHHKIQSKHEFGERVVSANATARSLRKVLTDSGRLHGHVLILLEIHLVAVLAVFQPGLGVFHGPLEGLGPPTLGLYGSTAFVILE